MRNIKNILTALFVSCLALPACQEENYNGLDTSAAVNVLSFTVNGSRLDKIDDSAGYIEVIMPGNTDLTTLVPVYTLPKGARFVLPEKPDQPTDLSQPVTYRVSNRNLYRDYRVLAKTVGSITRIEEMSVGKYKGDINHSLRTISIKYPGNADVTSLTPFVRLSEGAKLLSPVTETVDFTNPVEYKIEYLGETFTYTVQLDELLPVAFLGVEAKAADMTNMDDRTAYEWFAGTFELHEYVSFADIKSGAADLTRFHSIWYHYDAYNKAGDPAVHPDANDPAIVRALNEYLGQGGGLFLSSAAMALGNMLDIARDGKMWNNAWGYEGEGFWLNDDNGIGWGLRVKDPAHPVFNNIEWNTGETHRFFLIGNGCFVKAHNIRWNFFADWDGNVYNGDVARWEATNGGKQLASLHWDDAMDQVCVLTEYPAANGKGAVITMGAECYDWYNENSSPENKYRNNLQVLTENILNYISKK